MGAFDFLRYHLAWMVTLLIIWPVNIPLAALAYKIRQGHTAIDMESTEFWLRCTFAPLILAVATAGFVGVDYYLAVSVDFPAGIVHMVIILSIAALAWWLFYVFFALEDPFEGLSLFLIYLYLPMTVLFVINWLLGLWNTPIRWAVEWLKAP